MEGCWGLFRSLVKFFFLFLLFHPGGSDVLDEFRVEEREAEKLVLIQVHHEELVGRRQVQFLRRELLVKVADVFAMFLLPRPIAPNTRVKEKTCHGEQFGDCTPSVNEKERNIKIEKENELDSNITSYFAKLSIDSFFFFKNLFRIFLGNLFL